MLGKFKAFSKGCILIEQTGIELHLLESFRFPFSMA